MAKDKEGVEEEDEERSGGQRNVHHTKSAVAAVG